MDTYKGIELTTKAKERLALIKQEWLSSLYLFNKECLKAEEGKDRVELGAFHRKLCDFVDANPTRQKLILVPRGHLKSTLVTIGKVLQWIAQDPSVRILIANATYSMSVSFLTVIKRHLQFNEDYMQVFGPIARNPEKWSENAITLASAKSIGGEKETTIFCYGVGGNLTSQHYDKIILDDIINEDTVNTRDQIEKTLQFYRLCQPLLEKNGELIIIGTRYHEDDLYGHIMNKENGLIQDFEVLEKRAIWDELWDEGKKEYVKGEILWPEKYSLADLSEKKRKMGPYDFSSQYLNYPVAPSTADFRREWFKYYDVTDLRGLEMNKYLLVDPAISQDKEADYTGMIVVGVDQSANIYVLDIVRERMLPSQIINEIFRLNERWHPMTTGIEEVGFQRTLRYTLQKEMQERKRYITITELKPRARNKDQRIKGLQPQYANGKVLHNRDLVFNIYLEDELLRFPRGKHDDLCDALSYCLDLIHPPARRKSDYRKHKYLYG